MSDYRTEYAALGGFLFGAVVVTLLVAAYAVGHADGRHSMPVACAAMPVDTITHKVTRPRLVRPLVVDTITYRGTR